MCVILKFMWIDIKIELDPNENSLFLFLYIYKFTRISFDIKLPYLFIAGGQGIY